MTSDLEWALAGLEGVVPESSPRNKLHRSDEVSPTVERDDAIARLVSSTEKVRDRFDFDRLAQRRHIKLRSNADGVTSYSEADLEEMAVNVHLLED